MPEDRRKHIDSNLAAESLVSRSVVGATAGEVRAVLPDLWLILIGGSLFDRGKEALFPLVDKIESLRGKYQMALCAGSGVRERHTYKIGLDLGLPIGGLAMIAGAIPEQNALMLWSLMGKNGAVRLPKESIELVPFALAMNRIPILVAQPPYHYWEFPRDDSGLPMHGPDTGTILLAENFGCNCLILKDVDGIYDSDPYDNPDAKRIDRIGVEALSADGPETLPVERALLDVMRNTRQVTRVCVTSGLEPDNIEKILAGGEAGTVLEGSHAR